MSDQLFNILPLSLPTQMPGSAQLGQISTSGAAPAGFSFTSLLAPQAAPGASLPWSADGQSLPLPGEALPPANSAAGQPLPQLLAGLDAPADGAELSPGQLQALSEMLPEPLRNLDRLKQLAEESDDPVLQALARQLSAGEGSDSGDTVNAAPLQSANTPHNPQAAAQANAESDQLLTPPVAVDQHPAASGAAGSAASDDLGLPGSVPAVMPAASPGAALDAASDAGLSRAALGGAAESQAKGVSTAGQTSPAKSAQVSPPVPPVGGAPLPQELADSELNESPAAQKVAGAESKESLASILQSGADKVVDDPQSQRQAGQLLAGSGDTAARSAGAGQPPNTSNAGTEASIPPAAEGAGRKVSDADSELVAKPSPIDVRGEGASGVEAKLTATRAAPESLVAATSAGEASTEVLAPRVDPTLSGPAQRGSEAAPEVTSVTTGSDDLAARSAEPAASTVNVAPIASAVSGAVAGTAEPEVVTPTISAEQRRAATARNAETGQTMAVDTDGAEASSENTEQAPVNGRRQPVLAQGAAPAPVMELVSSGGRFEAALPENLQALLQRPVQQDKSATADIFSPATSAGGDMLSRTEAAAASISAMQSVAAQPSTAGRELSHQMQMSNQPQLNTPAWRNEMGEKAVWLSSQNNKIAEIQLDPPELGALKIKVQVNQDQVSLSFTSPHGAVRDAVEQAMPRLREMFAEQGMTLADSSVSDQSGGQPNEGRERAPGEFAGYDSDAAVEGAQGDAESSRSDGQTISLVDYYA